MESMGVIAYLLPPIYSDSDGCHSRRTDWRRRLDRNPAFVRGDSLAGKGWLEIGKQPEARFGLGRWFPAALITPGAIAMKAL
jgi:hypothetical protein